VWDFSAAQITGEAYSEKLGSENGRIAVTGDAGAVFQFDVTPYGNDFYGYKAPGYSVVYENPVLKTKYPFTYMDRHSGEYYGYIAQGEQKFVIDGTFSSEVDGYGTLKLPNGITLKNVLRVKTTETQKRYYCSANTYSEVKYLWYSQDFRYPVLVSIHNTSEVNNGGKSESQSTHVNVAALTPVAAPAANDSEIKSAAHEVEHKVYPNPTELETNITYTLTEDAKVSVAVYTSGNMCVAKIVDGQRQPAGSYSYTYRPQVSGIYFVRFALGDKVYVEQVVKK